MCNYFTFVWFSLLTLRLLLFSFLFSFFFFFFGGGGEESGGRVGIWATKRAAVHTPKVGHRALKANFSGRIFAEVIDSTTRGQVLD